jgi:proteasome lid subunit RPN8/RPN11
LVGSRDWGRPSDVPAGVIDDAIAHAQREAPKESCGVIIRAHANEVLYVPCRNAAGALYVRERFVLDPRDYAKAEDRGEVLAVVHSHPADTIASPSPVDRISCDLSGIPWLVVQPGNRSQAWLTPSAIKTPLPLIGRPWVWGSLDCWALVRDWFSLERKIELPDWPRPPSIDDFNREPLFDELFRDAGFEPIKPWKAAVGDVAMMTLGRGSTTNHVGVIDHGGMLLHHCLGSLSRRETYGEWLQGRTNRVVRYKPKL